MTVLCKDNLTEYEVFDITYDRAGYPQFLIYRENQWLRVSAKHFTPNYEKVFYNGSDAYMADGEFLYNEE